MRDISTFDSIANVGKIGRNIKNGHINATSTFTSASWLLMTRWITCVAHANDVFETCIAACSHILCPFSYLYISVQAEVAQPRTINNLENSTGLQEEREKNSLSCYSPFNIQQTPAKTGRFVGLSTWLWVLSLTWETVLLVTSQRANFHRVPTVCFHHTVGVFFCRYAQKTWSKNTKQKTWLYACHMCLLAK